MENCHFYIDETKDVPEEERCLDILCVNCKDNFFPDKPTWFWEGSTQGYGPFLYECSHCGKVIYSPDEETETTD